LGADHPFIPLLVAAPGIVWVLGYTIAADLARSLSRESPALPRPPLMGRHECASRGGGGGAEGSVRAGELPADPLQVPA
jgi:hypothetical protein